MAHTRAWSESTPDGASELAGTIDDWIIKHKVDVRQRMEYEHQWNDHQTTDGYHRPSIVGVAAKDTTTNFETAANYNRSAAAGANKADGAIGFDTDRQCVIRWDGTDWIPVTPYLAAKDVVTANTVSCASFAPVTFTGASATSISIAGTVTDHILVVHAFVAYAATTGWGRIQVFCDSSSQNNYNTRMPAGGGHTSVLAQYAITTDPTVVEVKLLMNNAADQSLAVKGGAITCTIYPYGIT